MSIKVHGDKGRQIPESVSRSSSLAALTPVMKDGVGEIVTKLVEIDDIIESLDTELSPHKTPIPDLESLLEDITELHREVRGIKLSQDDQIQAMRDEVKENTKVEISQLIGDKIESVIADAVATQVAEEMKEWSEKVDTAKLVGQLEGMVEQNDMLIRITHRQLENSRSRHANSTLDIQNDFNTELKPIKCRDGRTSQIFPGSLRELFSYDSEQLLQLMKEHDLNPLDKHSENLNRFLLFIGVNVSVAEQSVDFLEQLPAYPHKDNTGARGGGSRKGGRRASSASQDTKQNGSSLWGWL